MTELAPRQQALRSTQQEAPQGISFMNDPWLKALTMGLSNIATGHLSLVLPDGRCLDFGIEEAKAPKVTVQMHNLRAAKRILKHGDIGLGESYIDGDWSCDDLTGLIELALINERRLDNIFFGTWISGIAHFIHRFSSRNTKKGSRRNIAYHYNLGNDFYGQWLDSSMTYSSALFAHKGQKLENAQRNKYRYIAEIAELSPGDKVLEIGCGWGEFAAFAAGEYGCSLDGLTLSREQLDFAAGKIKNLDLQEQVKLYLRDYRDQRGSFDAIVSIEMFEAVGEENWDAYFQMLKRNLKDGAKAVLQVITIDDRKFDNYRTSVDFIQKYIFPGGLLPSKPAFITAAARNGLQASIRHEFGEDYADTLQHWKKTFQAGWDEISKLGFDEKFRRMWEFYLQYCEAGFRQKSIDVVIFELR